MKNIILPFIIMGLLVIGSCSDDAALNPSKEMPVDTAQKLNTIRLPKKVEIEFTNLPAKIKFHVYQSTFGSTIDYSTINDSLLQFRATFIPSDSLVTRQPSDTLKPESKQGGFLTFAMDTSQRRISHFSYVQTSGSYPGATSTYTKSIGLQNAEYLRSNDTIYFESKSQEFLDRIKEFRWEDKQSRKENESSKTQYFYQTLSTSFVEFLPFTDSTKIRILFIY